MVVAVVVMVIQKIVMNGLQREIVHRVHVRLANVHHVHVHLERQNPNPNHLHVILPQRVVVVQVVVVVVVQIVVMIVTDGQKIKHVVMVIDVVSNMVRMIPVLVQQVVIVHPMVVVVVVVVLPMVVAAVVAVAVVVVVVGPIVKRVHVMNGIVMVPVVLVIGVKFYHAADRGNNNTRDRDRFYEDRDRSDRSDRGDRSDRDRPARSSSSTDRPRDSGIDRSDRYPLGGSSGGRDNTCFEFKRTGSCKWAERCKFEHH
jgi:hypothetical protein